jgi:anthranilate/para-aminobenzoate synthase component II
MSTAAILHTKCQLEVAPRETAHAVVQPGPKQDWLISAVADVLSQVHKETPLRKDTVAAIRGALNSSGFKALHEDTKITLTAIFHEVTGRLGRAWDTVQLTINRLLLEDRTQVAHRLAELQSQAQDLHNCLTGAAHLGDALPHLAAFASAAGPLKPSDLSLHFSSDDHTPLVSICLNGGNIMMNKVGTTVVTTEHDGESDSSTVQQSNDVCYRILHVCTLDELYMLLPEVEQMNTMYDMDVETSPTHSNDDSSSNNSGSSDTIVLAAVEYQTQAHARLNNTLKLGLRYTSSSSCSICVSRVAYL